MPALVAAMGMMKSTIAGRRVNEARAGGRLVMRISPAPASPYFSHDFYADG